MTIGVGMLGCGGMGRVHAVCLSAVEGCRLVAAYDVDRAKSEAFVAEFGCRAAATPEEVVRDERVDCVYVCTPHDSHLALVREIADVGKPIYCEKPMGLNLDQATQMHRIVKSSGVLFMIGFNHRRNLGNLLAKQLARGFRPYMINVTFACPHYLEGWMGRSDQGSGILSSLACHAFDLACHFAGEAPLELTCLASRLRVPEGFAPDTAAIGLRFANGALASISLHDHAPDAYVWEPGQGLLRLEIFGKGSAIVSTGARDVVWCLGEASGLQRKEFRPYEYYRSWGYRKCAEDFIRAVREQTPVFPNEDDGLLAARLVDAAERAAASPGRTVGLTGPGGAGRGSTTQVSEGV